MTTTTTPANNIEALRLMMAESLTLAMQNAVARQQSDAVLASAATAAAASRIFDSNQAGTKTAFNETAPDPAPTHHGETQHQAHSSTNAAPESQSKEATELALQFVAYSIALSIQDAANHLRNLNTVAIAAIGTSLANMESSQDAAKATEQIHAAGQLLTSSANQLQQLWDHAAALLEKLSAASPSQKQNASTSSAAAGA